MQNRLTKYVTNLLHLKAVVECASINRAATLLGITQPALTRSIARLEAATETRLLHRSARGVTATEYGQALIRHIDAIGVELQSASNTLSLLKGKIEGVIACGAAAVSMSYLLPRAIHEFRKQRPRLHCRLFEEHTPALLNKLRLGELDLVIGSLVDVDADADLVVEALVTEEIDVFARGDHPVLKGSGKHLDELLAAEQWVLPGPWVHFHRLLDRELARRAISPPTAFVETTSLLAIRSFVLDAGYIALSSSLVFAGELRTGSVQKVTGDWRFPLAQTVIYRRRSDFASPIVVAFIKRIKQTVRTWPDSIAKT